MSKLPRPPATTLYQWQGKDRQGRQLRGEMRASGMTIVSVTLRRQGIQVMSIRKNPRSRTPALRSKDIALFTRQLAAMLKAGIPLLQAFSVVARSQTNAALAQLIEQLHRDVESGSSLHQALARHPRYFNALYCHLVAAGEQAGMLDELLASLARHQEKNLRIQSQIRTALIYPLAIVSCAVLVTAIIMIWVVPSFKQVFSSFGASLPWPTLVVIGISDFLADCWLLLLTLTVAAGLLATHLWRHSPVWRARAERLSLRLPLFGAIARKAAVARWARTLATMFGAGVPLVEALQAVGGAAGNAAYTEATGIIAKQVGNGVSLAAAIEQHALFPDMVGQMAAIGEESGALDAMLDKVADFYEIEVNEAVASLSTLLEPIIMLVLGVVIGALVIAMYLPIFKLGSVI